MSVYTAHAGHRARVTIAMFIVAVIAAVATVAIAQSSAPPVHGFGLHGPLVLRGHVKGR